MIHGLKYDKDKKFNGTDNISFNRGYDLSSELEVFRTKETILPEKTGLAFYDNYALRVLGNEKDNFRAKNFLAREHFNVLSGTKEDNRCENYFNTFRLFLKHGFKTHLISQIMLLKDIISRIHSDGKDFDLLNELLFSSKMFKFVIDNLPDDYAEIQYDTEYVSFKSVADKCIKDVLEFFQYKKQILNTDISDFSLWCGKSSIIKAVSAVLFHLSVRTPETGEIFFRAYEDNSSFVIKFISNALFPSENIFAESFDNHFDSVFSNLGLFFTKKIIENLNGAISVTQNGKTEITTTVRPVKV